MKGIASNAFFIAVNRLAQPLFGFLLMILIGRHSNLLLGEYTLVSVYFFIFQTLPLLGLTPYIMREAAKRTDEAPAIAGSSLIIACLAGALICLCLPFYIKIMGYSQESSEAITVSAYSIFPCMLAYIAELMFVSFHRTGIIGAVATFENLFRVFASIWAIKNGMGLVPLFWIAFWGRVFAGTVYFFNLKKIFGHRWIIRPERKIVRELIVSSPVFFINSILFLLVSRADFIILSKYTNPGEIGYYSVGYRVLDFAVMFVTAFVGAVYPHLSKADQGEYNNCLPGNYSLICIKSAKIITAATIPLCMTVYMLAEPFVLIIFPNQYPGSVIMLKILICCAFFAGIKLLTTGILFSSSRQNEDLVALASGSAVYIIALFVLVPVYGAVGAAIACIVEAVFQSGIRLFMIRGFFPFAATKNNRINRLAILTAAYSAASMTLDYFSDDFIRKAGCVIAVNAAYVYMILKLKIIDRSDLEFVGLGKVAMKTGCPENHGKALK